LIVISHRGASAEEVENTMAALELGMALGADAIELDVRRSLDGVLVVIHDETLDRTTSMQGAIASLSMDDIRRAAPPVPTLRAVFERFPDTEITVDVKDPEAADDVVALIEEFGRMERTILYVEEGTDSPAFSGYPGRRATSTRQALRLVMDRGWLRRASPRTVPEVVHTPLRRWGIRIVTQGLVQRVHDSGRTIQVWTVNDTAEAMRLADWNVDGVITDDVRGMRAALGARS
jgi:glycerophosphoryl diester phosphodiesterase